MKSWGGHGTEFDHEAFFERLLSFRQFLLRARR